jgi:hypothetical protein
MTDIFISYKQENREYARAIAEMFASHGYDVWWDIDLLPGQKFADEINSVIKKAKAVVVLWTPKSVISNWVKAETSLAMERGILIPALIEKVDLPAPYNTLHTIDLTSWDGSANDRVLEGLLAGVLNLIGHSTKHDKALSKQEIEASLKKPAHEAEFWSAVASGKPQSVDEYKAYLEKYGNDGAFSELAKNRIHEVEFWSTVSSKQPQSVDEYKAYLKKYGNDGSFAELARIRVHELINPTTNSYNFSFKAALTLCGVAVGIILGLFQISQMLGWSPEKKLSSPAVAIERVSPSVFSKPNKSQANSTPVARRDHVITDTLTPVEGNVFGAGFQGADYDPDGDAFKVFSVNGSTKNVGKDVVLESGASITLEESGDFHFDPRKGFKFLTKSGSSSADRVTYSIIDSRGARSLEVLSMFSVKKK